MDTSASSVFSVSPQELARLMGTLDAPVILDVRRQPAFAASSHTLATAQRCAPEDIPAFAATQPNGEVLVYCAFGHTVSQQAADILRKSGWSARFLAGGILGGEAGVDTPQDMAEWRSTPPPTIRKRPDLGVTGAAPSRWITRQRPKIDRIACPWLIRRFIDRRAEFFYVETAAVFTEGQRLQAVAYDIPGAPISHEGD